jgi:hypothetical protein
MATNEALVLDGLALNDGTNLTLEELDLTPPPELEEWVKGADSDGSLLAREPKCENRIITLTLRVEQKATMDLAIAQIKAIVDKLKECQRQANGLALTYLPHDSALPVITFRCLSGQVTGMPINVTSGWLVNSPQLVLKLTCLPFGQGAEVLWATITGSGSPQYEGGSVGPAGDVPALGRLVVKEMSSQNYRWMVWGLDSSPSTGTLILNSSVMTTTGYAGAANAAAGGSYWTSDSINAILLPAPQAVCALVNQPHVGTYRVFLRASVGATTVATRLVYKVGDGPYRALPYQVANVTSKNLFDLGVITIPPVVAGTQSWTGRIEAYSTATGGEAFNVDVIMLMPAESFGRARSTVQDIAGPVVAYDAFTGTTAAAVLNARVAPAGGTWTTSGVATDFVFADLEGGEVLTRSTAVAEAASGRIAAFGATSRTDVRMSIRFRVDGATKVHGFSLIPRYVSSILYAAVTFRSFVTNKVQMTVETVGGSGSANTGVDLPYTGGAWYRLWISVSSTGFLTAAYTTDGGSEIARLTFYDPTLATGGTLATGTARLVESHLSAVASTRYYDDIYITTPPPETMVCYSGQTIEVRHNTTLREDSTGVYYGPPSEYVGSRFLVPNAGGTARTSRVAVMMRRADATTGDDTNYTDALDADIYATPRYLVVPHA